MEAMWREKKKKKLHSGCLTFSLSFSPTHLHTHYTHTHTLDERGAAQRSMADVTEGKKTRQFWGELMNFYI